MMNGYLLIPKFSFALEGLEEFMLSKQWMIKRLFVSSGVYAKYPVSDMNSSFFLISVHSELLRVTILETLQF